MRSGTGVDKPDFLAVVNTNPESNAYGQIVHETPMPYVGDELHHFGWNRCSSAVTGPTARTWSSRASAPRGSTCSTSPTTLCARESRR